MPDRFHPLKKPARMAILLAASGLTALATPASAQQAAAASSTTTVKQSKQVTAEELALAQQIVELGFPEEKREAMFMSVLDQISSQTLNSIRANNSNLDQGAMDAIDEVLRGYIDESAQRIRVRIPGLMNALAAGYAETFNEQELSDILAFVKTPSGQVFFLRSSELLSSPSFAKANQEHIDETMASLPKLLQDLTVRLRAYEAEKSSKTGK